MRECGQKRASWARLGLGGSALLLCTAVVAVGSHSTAPDRQSWSRAVSDFIIAPADARPNRRSRDKGSDGRQAEAALKRAQQDIQQAEAARKHLQDVDAAQRRVQQMQELAAAQKRMQDLQRLEASRKQLEASQKSLQQVHVPRTDVMQKRLQHLEPGRLQQRYQPAGHQPSPNLQPAVPSVAERHRIVLEQTMAKLRGRHTAPRHETSKQELPRQTAGSRHQALIEQMTSKLRGRHQAPQQSTNLAGSSVGRHHQGVLQHTMSKLRRHNLAARNDRNDDRSGGPFGGQRHSGLQGAMDRLKARHHADRHHDRGRSDHGQHGSRQHAVYSLILTRLSRHGRRTREATKETAAATPPPAPVTAPAPVTPAPVVAVPVKKTTKPTNSGVLPDTPDLAKIVPTIVSKLPEVVSNTRTASESTKADSDSDRTMSRLGGPQQPQSDDRNSGDDKRSSKAKAQKKDDDSNADGNPPAKAPVRELGRRVAGALLPPPGTFRPDEVLAINMNAAGLKHALQRNFIFMEKVEYPALGFDLTRLQTPGNQNALIGRSALHEELPAEGFGLNHIYTAGRMVPSGADGVKTAMAVPSTPPPSANASAPSPNSDRRAPTPCMTDRCFGIGVINWQPQLAACARDIKVGVIDTGVDKSHPAFVGVRFDHEDFTPANGKKPSNQHGTGVLSLLAGNKRSSTPGLIPDATFLVGDAFFADRNGNAMSDTVTMLKALNWLKASGVDIANLSFAGPPDELVHDAIRELAKKGTVIVAAAGNEGQDAPPSYPAAYKEVIAVTAVDRNLAPYVYASRGNHIDVAAPGVNVWTALPNRKEGPQTGTSFAVPFVTSVVALSYRPEDRTDHVDPLGPKRQALALLQKNIKAIGGRGRTPTFGAGLVQAPSHCDPRGSSAVAGGKADGWNGIVQAAPPPANQLKPPVESWTSTVHPAANRK